MPAAGASLPASLTDWITTTKKYFMPTNHSESVNMASSSTNGLAQLNTQSDAMLTSLNSDPSSDMVTKICAQLIDLYRRQTREVTTVVNQFIPSLIYLYLSKYNTLTRSNECLELEACILTLYNLNVADDSGNSVTKRIVIPSFSKNSIYHEPVGGVQLSEKELGQHSQTNSYIEIGPFAQIEKLNSRNRMSVMSLLVRKYSQMIGVLSSKSHWALCQTTIKLCSQGFTEISSSQSGGIQLFRVPVSSELLLELLHCIYFVMFNDQPSPGLQALECIHQRAQYELYADVLIVTNAIKNSLEHNPSGQPHDGPMGVSIAITPACILSNLNKVAITNASFKTQKLPDDITVVNGDVEDDLAEPKNTSTASDKPTSILAGLRLSARPLKSALRKVERRVTKKDRPAENKDTSASPARDNRHSKTFGKADSKANNHQSDYLPLVGTPSETGASYHDTMDHPVGCEQDSFLSVDTNQIHIIIEPPINEETMTSQL